MKVHLALRVALLLALITGVVVAFIHFDLMRFFMDKHQLIEYVRAHRYDELVFIALQIIQVVIAVIPGELTGFIGGYIYGPVLGTIYSTIGLTLGSWLAFMLARFFGMPLLMRVVRKETFDKFEYFMEHKGMMVFFFLFLIPGFPKDYLCYIMGVSRVPVWSFIIISTIGRVFGTSMLSISGNMARNEQYILLGFIVLVMGVVSLLAYRYRDRILEMLKSKKTR